MINFVSSNEVAIWPTTSSMGRGEVGVIMGESTYVGDIVIKLDDKRICCLSTCNSHAGFTLDGNYPVRIIKSLTLTED